MINRAEGSDFKIRGNASIMLWTPSEKSKCPTNDHQLGHTIITDFSQPGPDNIQGTGIFYGFKRKMAPQIIRMGVQALKRSLGTEA